MLYERLVGRCLQESSGTSVTMSNKTIRGSLPAILEAVRQQISAIEQVKRSLEGPKNNLLPVMVLTFQEWSDLVHACVGIVPSRCATPL
jgi:hypothetical protein